MLEKSWPSIIASRHKRERIQNTDLMKNFYLYWLGCEDINASNIVEVTREVKRHMEDNPSEKMCARLYLGCNNLGIEGASRLAQIPWNELRQLNLARNNIKSEGCNYLCKGQWNHLIALDLDHNNIEYEGCRFLVKANWINFKKLHIKENEIGKQGCKILKPKGWKIFCDIIFMS